MLGWMKLMAGGSPRETVTEGSQEDAHEQAKIQAAGLTPPLQALCQFIPAGEPAPCSHPEFSWGLPRSWVVGAEEAEGPANPPPSPLPPSKALHCYFVLFPARCQLSSAFFFSPRFALPHSSGNQKQKERKENRLDLVGGGGAGEGGVSLPLSFLQLSLPPDMRQSVACHMTSAGTHVCVHVMRCPAMPGCGMEGKGEKLCLQPGSLRPEKREDTEERSSSLLPTCMLKALPKPTCWGKSVPRQCACRLLWFSLCRKICAFRAGRGLGPTVAIGATMDQIPAAETS